MSDISFEPDRDRLAGLVKLADDRELDVLVSEGRGKVKEAALAEVARRRQEMPDTLGLDSLLGRPAHAAPAPFVSSPPVTSSGALASIVTQESPGISASDQTVDAPARQGNAGPPPLFSVPRPRFPGESTESQLPQIALPDSGARPRKPVEVVGDGEPRPQPAPFVVSMPDGKTIQFPGDMSQEDVGIAIRRNFPEFRQGLLRARLNAFVQGVGEAVPAAATSVAALNNFLQREGFRVDEIAAVVQQMPPEQQAKMRQVIEGVGNERLRFSLQSRLSDALEQDGLGERAPAPTPIAEQPAVQFAERFRADTQRQFPVMPENEGFWSDVFRGLGTTTPIIAGSLVNPAAGVGLSLAMNVGESVDRAMASGATDDQIREAAIFGGLPAGLLDYASVANILRPITRNPGLRGWIMAVTAKAAEQGAIEGTTEAAQEFAQNLAAKITRDPNQALSAGVPQAFLVGATIGAITGAPVGAFAARRESQENVVENAGQPLVAPGTEPASQQPSDASSLETPAPQEPSAAPEAAAPLPPRPGLQPVLDEAGQVVAWEDPITGDVVDLAPNPGSEPAGAGGEQVLDTSDELSGATTRTTIDTPDQGRATEALDEVERIQREAAEQRARIAAEHQARLDRLSRQMPDGFTVQDNGDQGVVILDPDGEVVDETETLSDDGVEVFAETAQSKAAERRQAEARADLEGVLGDDRPLEEQRLEQRGPVEARVIRQDVAVRPDGEEIAVDFAVVDAADLITSHDNDGRINPAFPQGFQPRDRTRSSSVQQINDLAQRLNPRLLADSVSVTDGAPVIGEDGVVESGNGRSIAIRTAYERGLPTAERYRAFLAEQGFPIEGMRAPVLVRVRRTPLDTAGRAEFARVANERTTMSLSTTERALADAKAMTPAVLNLFRGGDVTAAGNADFARAFIDQVATPADRNQLIDQRGQLSQEGIRRLQNALLARAYGDANIIGILAESSDNNLKAIGDAMKEAAPHWAIMRNEAATDQIDRTMDATEFLLEAVRLVRRARNEGRSVREFLPQQDMFSGDSISDNGRSFLDFFFTDAELNKPSRSKDMIARRLVKYVEEARKTQPGAGLFGDEISTTPLDLIRTVLESTNGPTQERLVPADSASARESGGVGVTRSRPGGVSAEPAQDRGEAAQEGAGNRDGEPFNDDIPFSVAPRRQPSLEPTPQFQRSAEAVAQRFREHMDRLGLHDVGLRVERILREDFGEVFGYYHGNMIAVSLRSGDPLATLNHEIIHAMRRLGMFRPNEWRALARAAESDPDLMGRIDEDYGVLSLTRDERIEEAVAEMFAARGAGTLSRGPISLLDRLIERIKALWEALRSAFRGEGFTTPEQVFRNIETGRIGSRGRGLREAFGPSVATAWDGAAADFDAAAGRAQRGDPDALRPVKAKYSLGLDASDPAYSPDGPDGTPDQAGARSAVEHAGAGISFSLSDRKGGKEKALDAVSKQLDDLRGNDPKLPRPPRDIGNLAVIENHPSTIASLYPEFTPVYMNRIEMFEERDRLTSHLAESIGPYMRASSEDQAQVNKVLEYGRLQQESFLPHPDGQPLTVTAPAGYAGSLMKPGESVTLTPDQVSMYKAYRSTMNRALELWRLQLLREFGLGKKGDPVTASGVRSLAKKQQNEASRKRLEKLAERLDEVEQAKRIGYVPFTRYGNVAVTVVKKGDLGGQPEVVHYERVQIGDNDSKALRAVGQAFSEVQDAVLPKGSKFRRTVRALRARFPEAEGFEVRVNNFTPLSDTGVEFNLADLDQIATIAGADPGAYEQVREAIEKALKESGFRAHFVQATNVPGYSTDFSRSAAGYINGLANFIAQRNHRDAAERSVAGIRTDQGKLRRYARNYVDYTNAPSEEFHRLRGAVFIWYLAGNLSSAMVNLSQTATVTAPYLTQFASVARVTREISRAYKDAAKMVAWRPGELFPTIDWSKAPSDVRDSVKRAADDGLFVPMVTHEMVALNHASRLSLGKSGDALRRTLGTAADKAIAIYSAAERINRIVAYITALRIAKRPGAMAEIDRVMKNNALWRQRAVIGGTPDMFARHAVDDTQYRMGKVNRPVVLRKVGAVVFQFMSFTMNTLELMYKLGRQNGPEGRKAVGIMLGILFAAGGWQGLPFAEDLKDLFEALHRFATERDLDTEQAIHDFVDRQDWPVWWAEMFNRGIARQSGVDVSLRIGMGRVIPSLVMGVLQGKEAPPEKIGVAFDLLWGRPSRIAEYIKQDRYGEAAGEMMPLFLKNPWQAWVWSQEGVVTRSGNTIIPPEDLTTADLVKRAIGFNPVSVARERSSRFAEQRAETAADEYRRNFFIRLARVITDQTKALQAGDMAAADAATRRQDDLLQELAAYNDGSPPEHMIDLTNPSTKAAIKRRVLQNMAGGEARRTRRAARGRIEDIRRSRGLQ